MRTGENIYKRKDGRWEARYHKGRKEDGRIRYGSCYGKTYQEAKFRMEQAKRELEQGVRPALQRTVPSFESICDDWMQCNRLRLKQSTWSKYRMIIDKYLKPNFGCCALGELSTAMVSNFGAKLLNEYGLAPKTAKDILVLLHSLLEYGAKHHPGIIGIIDVTYPKKETKEMRVLTKTEQKTLTNYLLQDLNPCKFGVLLALWTGMRIGEVCALQWKQISFQEQSIKVEKTMLRLQNYNPGSLAKTMIVVDSPKTASSVRVIPMSKPVAALCQRMNVNNQQAYILTGSERYMEPRKLQYHFSRYLDSCNLKNVTFHTLRHTFATRCVEMDFEIKGLSEILGHASTAITLDRYVHCSMELKRENMHKLDTLILGNL